MNKREKDFLRVMFWSVLSGTCIGLIIWGIMDNNKWLTEIPIIAFIGVSCLKFSLGNDEEE